MIKNWGDSIISKLEYSANLQKAFLPKKRHFDKIFQDSFQIYAPYEYLSGDFFWVAECDDLKFAAVGDSTGHGVSAAFLSMLCYNFLNYAVHTKELRELNQILKQVDKDFIEAFSSLSEDKYDNDWIDLSIISYNKKTNELAFAGANRKLLIIEGKERKILKGSQYPIGGWQIEADRKFETQKLTLRKANIYLGSDGFQDQYNEAFTKRIGSKKLHQMLLELNGLSMVTQKNILMKYFNDWKGSGDQTDDVCMIGISLDY